MKPRRDSGAVLVSPSMSDVSMGSAVMDSSGLFLDVHSAGNARGTQIAGLR
jgi:hypothetical protein